MLLNKKKVNFLIHLAIACLIIVLAIYFLLLLIEKKIQRPLDFDFMSKASSIFLNGFKTTLFLSILALFFSLLFGFILNSLSACKILFIRIITGFVINITRGIPILVYVFLLYYGFFNLFGMHNKFLIGFFIISLFSSAYIAEIIRSGINSIPKGQFEAGKALGLNDFQLYKEIIIPQTIKIIIPALTGQLASIIKDTSILSVISIREFTMTTREISSNYFLSFEAYIPLAIGYLILILPISFYSKYYENKLKKQVR